MHGPSGDRSYSRRGTLLGAGGVFVALAGCTADDTGDGGDLDLREANVTAVELVPQDDRRYRVATTLIHDDDGEDGYANWWQVETLDGERLGRRDLAHPHGTRAFTRSITVALERDRVVVRGHDQTHGYGGQAALVSVPDGETTLVRQGAEAESFADRRSAWGQSP